MNKKRVMTCLAAGVCILAVSATAAFGSVNGYANYKSAVKNLALTTDNVSAKATFSLAYDGKEVVTGEGEVAKDGRNNSSHFVIDGQEESYSTTLDGATTWFNVDDDHYYTSEASFDGQTHGLLDVSEEDAELTGRIINFLELGADTLMGDLKNNVVETGASDGEYTYQLDISHSQVPALVNAGLSVLAYAVSDSIATTSYVEYQDYDQAAFKYYEQQTGKILDEDFLAHYRGDINDDDWWSNNDVLDKFNDLQGEMTEHYDQVLEREKNAADSSSGILYVANDGSTTFYKDVAAYHQSNGDSSSSMSDFEAFVGKDLTLDNVHFTFTVNKAGQLTANHFEATFTTVDLKNVSHSMVLTGDISFFDYGSTVVQPLDTGDRISWNDNQG